MPNETIHFVIMGGTIDSFYEGTKDTIVPNKKSIIPSFVKSLKLYSKTEFTEICMKDSRDVVKADRNNVLRAVEKSPHKKIIITHGTYTMPDTARFLKSNIKRTDQTIVLTGSMIPISGFSPSDGPFSIGYAIAKVQDLAPGIYVCMNGRIFLPEEVIKVSKEGRFASIFGENK